MNRQYSASYNLPYTRSLSSPSPGGSAAHRTKYRPHHVPYPSSPIFSTRGSRSAKTRSTSQTLYHLVPAHPGTSTSRPLKLALPVADAYTDGSTDGSDNESDHNNHMHWPDDNENIQNYNPYARARTMGMVSEPRWLPQLQESRELFFGSGMDQSAMTHGSLGQTMQNGQQPHHDQSAMVHGSLGQPTQNGQQPLHDQSAMLHGSLGQPTQNGQQPHAHHIPHGQHPHHLPLLQPGGANFHMQAAFTQNTFTGQQQNANLINNLDASVNAADGTIQLHGAASNAANGSDTSQFPTFMHYNTMDGTSSAPPTTLSGNQNIFDGANATTISNFRTEQSPPTIIPSQQHIEEDPASKHPYHDSGEDGGDQESGQDNEGHAQQSEQTNHVQFFLNNRGRASCTSQQPIIASNLGINPKPVIDALQEAENQHLTVPELMKALDHKALTCKDTAEMLSNYVGCRSRARDILINASMYADIEICTVSSRRGNAQMAFKLKNRKRCWFVAPQTPLHALFKIRSRSQE